MSQPIRSVLFDFHSTLVDNGSAPLWLANAEARLRRSDPSAPGLTPATRARLEALLHRVWESAREIDPKSERDLSPQKHRDVFLRVMKLNDVSDQLANVLYDAVADGWTAYDDAPRCLAALRAAGVRLVLISNVGFDIRGVLQREKLLEYFGPENVVLSCEVGVTKPNPHIFREALKRHGGLQPETCLMVGDNWADDGGAGSLGIRVLIIPRSDKPVFSESTKRIVKGLDDVVSLVLPSTRSTL